MIGIIELASFLFYQLPFKRWSVEVGSVFDKPKSKMIDVTWCGRDVYEKWMMFARV